MDQIPEVFCAVRQIGIEIWVKLLHSIKVGSTDRRCLIERNIDGMKDDGRLLDLLNMLLHVFDIL